MGLDSHIAVGVGLALALAATAGCTAGTRQPHGHEPNAHVVICGRVLASGAALPSVHTLSPPRADVPVAPSISRLPAPYHGPHPGLSASRIVRVASGCSRGMVVLVRPTDRIRLQTSVRAPDGTLIALVLIRLSDAPATVYAYRNGKATGEIMV